MPAYSLRDPAVLAFVILPAALAAAFVWGVHAAWQRSGAPRPASRRAAVLAAAGTVAWLSLTLLAARSGILRQWTGTPPPFAILVITIFAMAAAISFSRMGGRLARLPLWMLVAIQSFRFPLEIAMHRMYERGIMPEPMSYSGRNYDIVTGVTAIVVAALVAAGAGGRRLVFAWNLLGTVLLANIIMIAILATPRFAYFGVDQLNVWVTYPPFVWLPAMMVLAALIGHAVVFRALARLRRG